MLDQNLSPKLIRKLADIFPGLESVYNHSLVAASDPFIFEWAKKSNFAALITADQDLVLLAERLGAPPKVIRIDQCDYPSAVIEQLIRQEAIRIHAFLESDRAVLRLKRQGLSGDEHYRKCGGVKAHRISFSTSVSRFKSRGGSGRPVAAPPCPW